MNRRRSLGQARPVLIGMRDDKCPLCRMTGAELMAFWSVLLEDGEAFVPDAAGGFRRYELADFEGGDPAEHFERARLDAHEERLN